MTSSGLTFELRYFLNVQYIQIRNTGHAYVQISGLVFFSGFIFPLENFSLIWRRHHYLWRAANFNLCSALIAIEQWEFFSVPHLLWHVASVYDGHLSPPRSYQFCTTKKETEKALFSVLEGKLQEDHINAIQMFKRDETVSSSVVCTSALSFGVRSSKTAGSLQKCNLAFWTLYQIIHKKKRKQANIYIYIF